MKMIHSNYFTIRKQGAGGALNPSCNLRCNIIFKTQSNDNLKRDFITLYKISGLPLGTVLNDEGAF
jgi:hypothetical protein